ncbi:MAG TPA: pitrilysin family protein [Gemmatimonadales bacterium]|jgi:predicted Zn-dependent peptidase
MHRAGWLVGLASVALAAPISGQAVYQFEDYRLDNGLRVILSENHSAAVVAIDIWYSVGSRDERPGRSGFAHLFEHMMFQGSENAPEGFHRQSIQRAGGSMNGTTNEDRTAYFETLPANRLNLGLWLEADRMRSLAITDENFENQRQAVKEERRLRVDNQPYSKAFIEGPIAQFDEEACFPYAHTVIGSMDDLDAAETPDIREFFDQFYAPNNATLVVVGDFEPTVAKQLIQQYFGDIPRAEEPPAPTCDVSYGAGPERLDFPDPLANLPAVFITYLVPRHNHPDAYALQLLTSILGGGESSRLNRSLVRAAQTAVQAFADVGGRMGPSQFSLIAIANQGKEIGIVEEQLAAEMAKIADEGVTEAELQKAKNGLRASQVFGRQTAFGLAESLQHYAHNHDSLAEINTDLDRYMAVTTSDIQRVARQYLTAPNSLTITVIPATAGQGGTQ